MVRKNVLSTEIVMNKAFELAKKEGVDAVTYNRLARELDIRPQSMYRYVKDLKTLRVALLQGFLTELVEKLKNATDGMGPTEALEVFAIRLYDECHKNPWYYESFELMNHYKISEEMRQPLSALVGIAQMQMEQLVADKNRAGRYTQFYMALIMGYAMMAIREFMPVSLQDNRRGYETSVHEFIDKILSIREGDV